MGVQSKPSQRALCADARIVRAARFIVAVVPVIIAAVTSFGACATPRAQGTDASRSPSQGDARSGSSPLVRITRGERDEDEDAARGEAQGRTSAQLEADGDARDAARGPRALVFRSQGFPTIDAPAIPELVLDTALAGMPVHKATSADELSRLLRLRDFDVLVLPYGSAFPVDAWARIRTFLHRGGGLVVLGGAPFHEPVRTASAPHGDKDKGDKTGGDKPGFVVGPRQPAFAHDLLIGPAEPVARPPQASTRAASNALGDTGFVTRFPEAKTTWALTLRLATHKDMPDEHGSAGPRDAVARPLVHVVDAAGIPRGCPLLEIDHHHGDAASARWLLATSDATLDAPTIRAIVGRALEGASELRGQPLRASVPVGSRAQVRVTYKRFAARAGEEIPARAHVVVTDRRGGRVFATDVTLAGPAESRTGIAEIRSELGPGLYHVAIEIAERGARRIARTGFVVHDAKLFAAGPKLSVGRDWLRKDGRVFPVIGTTYMASDVHRKFLFEPNPHVWDADFAEMEKRGINFVRTGLWTAWSRAALDPGAIDETVLDALDAYVHTAARHGIVVCFDFFAFLPPSFTGKNPYLDPRAIDGQRDMLTQFASRYAGNGWIHWDLINEPSYAPRAALWKTRAIGDEHERRAWTAWVRARHGNDIGKLRALWHEPSADPAAVPKPEDFEQGFVEVARRPRKARDFREFTEDVVAGWAARMRDVLRASSKDTLVTLGQDEGGIYERATQQLLAPSLDYTAVHTWWKNDDLLWDGVLTKVPDKPSLHQETGLMRLEDIDGGPWRTPQAAARLLERKIAYAFAGRGTGVVEWAWNVNPYMPIDEESTIGLYRPDGTAKPELDPLVSAATFFRSAAPLLDDFEPDPVVLVVPHARVFLGRTNALDATKVVVRALAERFGVVPTAVSDLRVDAAHLKNAKLVIVSGADVLDERAARALLDASRAGAKVLITGPIEGDSYGMETPSLRALGVLGASRPVAMHERSAWSASGLVTFEGLLQESVRRADRPSGPTLSGSIWHEPLPLELARDREPLVKLLGAALAGANVATSPGEWGLAARVLVGPRALLVVVVNERPERAVRRVDVMGRSTLDVPVAPLGARLALVDRATLRVVAATPGEPIASNGASRADSARP